jgi:hypothetical protein
MAKTRKNKNRRNKSYKKYKKRRGGSKELSGILGMNPITNVTNKMF